MAFSDRNRTGFHLDGIPLREHDLEPQRGLHFVSKIFRASAVVIVILALVQFVAWWLDPPPNHMGIGVLVGDTVRLIVLAALLVAVGEFAHIIIRTHYDVRAARILLAREAHMLEQMGHAQGWLPPPDAPHSRADEADTDA
jgi:hypothetical protein